jgi:hypothetical protein
MRNISQKPILVIGALVIFGFCIVLVKFYGGYWYDLYRSPWAYSKNPTEKLLIGTWQGDFTDPDGVKKHLIIKIVEPTTEDERWERAFTFKKHRRSGYKNYPNLFDGFANVKSKLGLEEYSISGHVENNDYHQFVVKFSPVDEKKRVLPNFTLFESTQSVWQDDKMDVMLKFSYHKVDGSSFWSSSIPKYSAQIKCQLQRETPPKK